MRPHNSKHSGQPEPASCEFGGEERVEDPLLQILGDAAAAVGHLQHDIALRRKLGGEVGVGQAGGVDLGERGGYAHQAAFRTGGLDGVEEQIHRHLLELAGVGPNRRKVGCEIQLQAVVWPGAAAYEVGGFAKHGVEVHGAHDETSLARVGEHLAAEVGGALGG